MKTTKQFPSKVYNYGVIDYSYSLTYKKWVFSGKNGFTFLSRSPGGAETAHKIARILNGSISRKQAVDNMARANISRLVNTHVPEKQWGI